MGLYSEQYDYTLILEGAKHWLGLSLRWECSMNYEGLTIVE